MAESLWLAVCSRRDSLAPLIVSRRVDDDGLSVWAAELGASDSNIVDVWLCPLSSEKTVTFRGSTLDAMVEEHKERAELARLKAKYEPAAAVVGVPGPVAVGSAETKPVVLVAPEDAPGSPSITYPEIPKPDAPGVKFYEPSVVVTPEGLVGPEFDVNGDRVLRNGMKLPDRSGSIDGADYLAQLLRWFRPRLSMGSALTAAREAKPADGFTPTETAIKVFADRASALDDTYAELRGSTRKGKEPVAPPAEEPTPAGVASLASMARQVRPSLSGVSCLAAARELYHKLGGYSAARAAEAVADRAALLDAGIPSASIVGGP